MSKCIRLLLVATAICVLWSAGPPQAWAAGDPVASKASKRSYTFESARGPGDVDRVAVVLEVQGKLKSPGEAKVEQSKMDVRATVVYDERTLETPDDGKGPLRSIRHYDQAEARLDVAEGNLEPRLRGQRKLMGVEIDGAKVTLFSPHGELTRDELDLVDLLANSLLVDRFLPGRPVAQGGTWTHADELIIAAFGLDRIAKNTITSKLASVDDDSAMIEMSGRINGAINGVPTEIEVKGKYRFGRKTRRVDWFGLLVRENREVGPVAPGFDVVARLRMQIKPRDEAEQLTDAALADLPLKPNGRLTQLVYAPDQGGWRFQHDRRWFLTGSDRELAFLRLIDRGDLVAQCNVAALSPVEPGKQATLEQFQKDIKEALGENFGEFVSAGQKANDQDYRVLNAVVRGTVSSLPIEWHYYLVADEHGRQVTFTFTVEGPLAERLGQMDRQMVESLRFDEPKVAMHDKSTP
ncbi:MAG: hypothetical protein JW888_03670 [Pirellulales bacterium]|nr:hypothetical protein [Pirellulales bacterium]